AAGVSRRPRAYEAAGVAALVTHRSVAVSNSDCSAGVAAGGRAGGAGSGRTAAFDDDVGHVADRRRGGVHDGDGLDTGGEVAAIIGRLPGAGDDAGVAADRHEGVRVAD